MRSMKGGGANASASNHEEEEYDEEELVTKKDGPSYNANTATSSHSNACNSRDPRNNDRANAIRSKHSVTEQRRRSKINERFQILRDLIPHSDQKRDTASFLLEVIEYVQFLQERVQKYEGTYQGWTAEPAKLMPWRNSHWRVQSYVGPQGIKNGCAPGSTFAGKLDENNISMTPNILTGTQNQVESDPSREMDHQSELTDKGLPLSMPLQTVIPPVRSDGAVAHPLHRPLPDAQSTDCSMSSDAFNQQEELTIEGGTISISSVYSHGLLSSLTQALQSAGVDLSHAKISVQIDLGKRANRGQSSGASVVKNHEDLPCSHASAHLRDTGSGDDSDHVQKRLKT